VIGIELGWVLALRAGWPLATTGLASQAAVAGLVVLVGLLVFRERQSAANLVGLAFCLTGLTLVARR